VSEDAWVLSTFLKHAPQGALVPRVLVADDNSNIQKMATLALKDAGIDVVAVSNGEAAVRKLADLTPDLILADIFMPVRSGYELCEYIKQHSRYSHVPVILLVGAFDPFDEKEARRVQADGVLKKPFVPADPLVNMVKALLARLASENQGEDTVSVSTGPSFSPVEAFHSGPSRAELARAATRASQPVAATLAPSPSSATEFATPELAETEFATLDDAAHAPVTPSSVHDSQAGAGSLLEIPDAEAEADMVSTPARDPSLGEPAFWSSTTKVNDEPVAEIAQEHTWGLGAAPQHEENVLPAFDPAAELEIESTIGPTTSGALSDVGAAAEFEASASEIKDHADSDVVHDDFAAAAIDEAPAQLEATSAPEPALDLASTPTLDSAPDSTIDPAPGPTPGSVPDVALDATANLEFDRTSDSTSEATSVPSAYDDSAAPASAVVEEAPATSEPTWHLSQAVEEWESTIAAATPATEPEPLAKAEAPPELDAVREPVEVPATEPEQAPEVEMESRTCVSTDSESQPVPEINAEPELETAPQADSYVVNSVVPECETQEHVPDAVVAAQEIVADNGARYELTAERQPDSSAISAAVPEREIQEHIPEPVPAAQDFVTETAPSTVSAEEPHASGSAPEATHKESAVAHDAPLEPAESDRVHQPLVDAPWTSLHWSAALQNHEAKPDAMLPETPDTSAPETSAPQMATPSERADDSALAHAKASDIALAAIPADVHDALPAANASAVQEPQTPEEMEATVTRMLERMQPKVAELLTREILRPIIEALVRGELSKR
jgi:CheY-like chemotaxis protein